MPPEVAADAPPQTSVSMVLYTNYQYVHAPDPLLSKSRHQAMKALMVKAERQKEENRLSQSITIRWRRFRLIFGRRNNVRTVSGTWLNSTRPLGTQFDLYSRQ
jgi:hypothetical protein